MSIPAAGVEQSKSFRELPNIAPDFGNDWLSNAQEISLPSTISYAPAASTLSWLLVLIVVLLGCGIWVLIRRHQARLYQRQAAIALDEIQRQVERGQSIALGRIPELLKQAAFCLWSRAELIAFDTNDWLQFWQATADTAPPSSINSIGYQSEMTLAAMALDEQKAIIAWSRLWISQHRSYRHQSISQLLHHRAKSSPIDAIKSEAESLV